MAIRKATHLTSKPVAEYRLTLRGEYALGVKLYALHVVAFMLKPHDIAVIISGSYFEVGRKTFFRYYPAVVTAHFDLFGKAFE